MVSCLVLGALLGGDQLHRLLERWGYLVVFVIVALQSLGAPLPGTTAVIAAALYAGSTHRLSIVLVVLAAAVGAIAGSLAAFAVGRRAGTMLLARHGHRVGLSSERVRVGRRLIDAFGGRLVFFGRFITGLRNTVAFFAGAGDMDGWRFTLVTVAAAITWALLNGLGYYIFGEALRQAGTPAAVGAVAVFLVSLLFTGRALRRRWRALAHLEEESPAGNRPP